MKQAKTKIKIRNTQKKIPVNKNFIERLAMQALRIKGVDRYELSILFAGKRRMQSLNKRFRKAGRSTDVLAFHMFGEKRGGRPSANSLRELKREGKLDVLGDVVICPEIAAEYARLYRTTTKYELALYLVHGILHLLGYKDTTARQRALMEKEQERILEKTKYFSKL
jgi:probable rRNA maturation factor